MDNDKVRFFDIAAWKEDRDELRRLRQQALEVQHIVNALAGLLQADADKIEHACDILDRMSRDLDRIVPAQ